MLLISQARQHYSYVDVFPRRLQYLVNPKIVIGYGPFDFTIHPCKTIKGKIQYYNHLRRRYRALGKRIKPIAQEQELLEHNVREL